MSGPLFYDRVMESSSTSGTGPLTLSGAVAGFQSFSVVGNGNTCCYCIYEVDASGTPDGDWEVGLGTYTSSGTTLSRDTILASSNGGAAVNFDGNERVILTSPAAIHGVGPGINGGRLTLTTATPVPSSDVTGATTVYWTPSANGQIALPVGTGGPWQLLVPGEKSVAVPSTLFRLFDVFGYLSSGTLALETVNWNQSTATINGCTPATETLQTSAAHGLSVGDIVGIASIVGTVGTHASYGLNGRIWRVSAVPTTTTFQLNGTYMNGGSLGYTSGGTVYTIPSTRATALTTLHGVNVKNGDASRVYLGTGMTQGGGTGTSSPTSGQCEDSGQFRFLWNHYNRALKLAIVDLGTSGTISNVTTQRYVGNIPASQYNIVSGLSDQQIVTHTNGGQMTYSAAGGSANYGRISTGTQSFALTGSISETANADLIRGGAALIRSPLTVGLNWFPFLEATASSTGSLTYTSARCFANYMG